MLHICSEHTLIMGVLDSALTIKRNICTVPCQTINFINDDIYSQIILSQHDDALLTRHWRLEDICPWHAMSSASSFDRGPKLGTPKQGFSWYNILRLFICVSNK